MKFCELCKFWENGECQHSQRAFINFADEYGCQYFEPRNAEARIKAIQILKEAQRKLTDETQVIRHFAVQQIQRAGINIEQLSRAITKYWRLAFVSPREHSPRDIKEARKLLRRCRSHEIRGYLTRIINEAERAKALNEIMTARAKMRYWQETARQNLAKQITKYLDGDLKLAWLILTSNKEDIEQILKTGRQQQWERRRAPKMPPHIKRYIKKLMARDLDINEVPTNILNELEERGLAEISEEEGVIKPTEYLLSIANQL